ncbi:putative F-box/LRR-repeat protein At3g28410 isoform X2 [Cynara cardunculus var. scolymus]|uniref:putative F-box/LRR-repeat protein At3g28410 isoform X2 n=1 Tax=Cynara cardunculus var. scolymus TaxID=59895 RepID=UPI000D627573|nr:putative F-box/LRR-repeat protein At3g28410 isoform X2 [Cynara cardunculus var. scolymus]
MDQRGYLTFLLLSIKMGRRGEKRSWDRIWNGKHGILDPQDTISRLPENVLHHIISFLPSTDKDQLQFLSRKWNRLYAQSQKKLFLKGVRLDEQKFSKSLVDVFPSVEDLSLEYYSGMKKLRLVNYKLKIIKLYCGSLKNLDLTTPHLEYFEFVGYRFDPCRIELGICKQLRFVTLGGVAMDNMMFADCNSSFPVLQALTLFGCDMKGHINISSNSLDHLSLLRFKRPVDVTIDCPNLHFFEYSGSRIVPFLDLNMPYLEVARIEIYSDWNQKHDELWYGRLIEMLGDLNHANLVVFITDSDKILVIPKRYREILVPPLKGFVKLVTWSTYISRYYADLINSFLWLSPDIMSIAAQCRSTADAFRNRDYTT